MNNPTQSKNPWPLAIIGSFAAFISFLAGFAVFASRQNMDLVRPDYYEAEMLFQQQLDRLERTRPLLTGVTIAYDARQQTVTIRLPADHAQRSASGRIHFYRPSDASLDRHFRFVVPSDGVQRVETKSLRAGLWKVRLRWNIGEEEFYFDQSILVPPHSS